MRILGKGEYKNCKKSRELLKSEFEIGDIVCGKYKIISIKDKGLYNMYICLNNISKCKTSFTDMDVNENGKVNI